MRAGRGGDLFIGLSGCLLILLGLLEHLVEILHLFEPGKIGILLPKNQRQHRTLHTQKDALSYALG